MKNKNKYKKPFYEKVVLEEKIFGKSEFFMLFSIEYLIIIMYHF